LRHGAVVEALAGPDVRRDRPARDHHHADEDRDVGRLTIPAGAVLGEVHRPRALEGRAGEVGEDQLGLEAEAVAEVMVQRHFAPVLGRDELLERAVPGVPLPGRDADPSARVPGGDEAPAPAIADEVGLEPAGAPVFAGRGEESIGDEPNGPVRDRAAFGLAEGFVAGGPEAALIDQDADGADGSPGRGSDDLGISRRGVPLADVATAQSLELGEDLDEEIVAAAIGDDALLDLSALAVGFDEADVFVE
jgi:hypothetical protein